jgi:hypothetical protein
VRFERAGRVIRQSSGGKTRKGLDKKLSTRGSDHGPLICRDGAARFSQKRRGPAAVPANETRGRWAVEKAPVRSAGESDDPSLERKVPRGPGERRDYGRRERGAGCSKKMTKPARAVMARSQIGTLALRIERVANAASAAGPRRLHCALSVPGTIVETYDYLAFPCQGAVGTGREDFLGRAIRTNRYPLVE